ncbi:MAG: diacylglycerol kinase family protein [Deltaproteobacteria bacterium]|jgi:diacylglycerol kinase family enzyme|nr:diacylglycerol kinase family protein [Deltaproteobacteria bacterium]
MAGIGIISNANARLNKLSPNLKDRLNFILGRKGELVSTYSLEDVEDAVEAFKKIDVDIIAISGGDGTAHRTLEKILPLYDNPKSIPPVLLLPSGTQNMVPKSLGITTSSLAALMMTRTKYLHNIPMQTVSRNLLQVNDHYSFMFGLGAAPRFLQEHYAHNKGHFSSITLFFSYVYDAIRKNDRAFELIKPIEMEAFIDGKPYQDIDKLHTIFCSFVEEVALRFKCFPRSGWQKDKFESLFFKSGLIETLKAVPGLWLGSKSSNEKVERKMVSLLELKLKEPEPYTLDGDLYPPHSNFIIKPGPELKFVIPGISKFDRKIRVRSGKTGPWGRSFHI